MVPALIQLLVWWGDLIRCIETQTYIQIGCAKVFLISRNQFYEIKVRVFLHSESPKYVFLLTKNERAKLITLSYEPA